MGEYGFSACQREYDIVEGVHLPGAMPIPGVMTVAGCLSRCDQDEDCLAVDYDNNTPPFAGRLNSNEP